MRYVGQGHEIRVDLPDGPLGPAQRDAILAAFERVYRELYERGGPPVPVELITWRVVSRGPTPGLQLQVPRTGASDANLAGKGVRQAYFPETGFHPTPVYDRYRLGVGASFDGPAIVEERESTLVIGPGARCRVDAEQNIVVLLY
jgi:N-methylhydantoinase A